MKRLKYWIMMLACCGFFSWMYPEVFLTDNLVHTQDGAEYMKAGFLKNGLFLGENEIRVKSYLLEYLRKWLGMDGENG